MYHFIPKVELDFYSHHKYCLQKKVSIFYVNTLTDTIHFHSNTERFLVRFLDSTENNISTCLMYSESLFLFFRFIFPSFVILY